MESWTFVGYVAAATSTASFTPQAWKVIRTSGSSTTLVSAILHIRLAMSEQYHCHHA